VADIREAQIVAFYLFDVAESADLRKVATAIGGPAVPARLAPKPATPAYVQYGNPPLTFDGEAVGVSEISGFRTRVRSYDYGVVSIGLTQSFAGTWSDLTARSQRILENADLESRARTLCRAVMSRLTAALSGARTDFLSEDYVVFSINSLDRPLTADALIEQHGGQIAALLRGERQELSGQERQAILSHRLSYLADDLVVPTWNAALVYDTPGGAQAALEILEFANSQLLEFRHYDQLLDDELGSIYKRLQRPRRLDHWFGGRYTRAARQVHALFIDVNELTDRTENTVKFIGDIYAVRLFRLAADRLGLDKWKADVEAKLETLDDIYRFAVELGAMARGQFLELTVVVILVLELVLILMGITR
jgi:hypothetical protein